MTVVAENLYGAFEESRQPFLNQYGVATDEYGVVPDPFSFSFLLLETGDRLLQENGDNIWL